MLKLSSKNKKEGNNNIVKRQITDDIKKRVRIYLIKLQNLKYNNKTNLTS
jgi:hypothetical protein